MKTGSVVIPVMLTLGLSALIEGRIQPQQDNCELIRCSNVDCKDGFVPPGECCMVCPKDKCQFVKCKAVNCKDSFIPEGQCCPECPAVSEKLCVESFMPMSEEYVSKRIPANRTVVGACTYDVGTCPTGTCRYNIFRHESCPDDGIICPVVETRKVNCGVFGSKVVSYVTHCACCEDYGITVVGTVTDYHKSEPLSAMSVSINTNGIGATDNMGLFKAKVAAATRVVIQVTDPSGKYIAAVKVIDLPATYRDTLNVEIKMIKAAAPVTVDPTVDNKLSISGEPKDVRQGVAQLVIEANSITDITGNPYSKSVKISITAPNVKDAFTDEIGQFVTSDGEALLSDGIVKVDLRTESGEPLTGRVIFSVRQGMVLWLLDDATGRWTLAPTTNVSRRKRQISLTDALLTQINTGNWYNIDRIPGVPRCFFKARVFYENPADAANPATFTPGVVAYTPNNQRLRLYFPYTSDLDNTCFEVRCIAFNPANPTNVLIGIMNLASTETVSIGGSSIPLITNLKPKGLANYSPALTTAHSAVRYDALPNQKEVFVNFISNPTGGFYEDLATCQTSTIDQPAFHFIKPSLPAYEPIPDGTNLCTARINFTDKYQFSAAIDDLPTMPGFTAISVWSSAGSYFYYTYSTTIQKANDGVHDYYYACIQYRCSRAQENTDVYLNIDIPLVQHFNTFTNNVTQSPAFQCWGPCNGMLCKSDRSMTTQSSIEGAFTAPELLPGQNGPALYDGTKVTDCSMRNSTEKFAYTFDCNSKYRRSNEDSMF